jgi:UPF0148 protein
MMSGSREKMQLTVELMRRGAVMLKEPCPVCNGVQIRFRGKVYCTNHDDVEAALSAKEITYGDVTSGLRDVLLGKLKDGTVALEREKDPQKQEQLVSLMIKYMDLLKTTTTTA